MVDGRRKGLTTIGLLGVGLGAGLLLGLHEFGDFTLPIWATVLVIGGFVAASLFLSWKWWQRLDEVAREAHKFAWYWGGSAGLSAGLLMVVFVDTGRLAAPLLDGPSSSDGFVAGALTVMMAQVVGYGVAWLGWWWSRR
ncbi:MAG: hypothetical protein U1C74_29870 [Phenylobacterium sp.]|nr:hypothetical protein [Phenylobacterium sp.]